jgi:hypothetical protein
VLTGILPDFFPGDTTRELTTVRHSQNLSPLQISPLAETKMKRSLYIYTKNNRELENIPEFANSILVSGDPLYSST